MSIVVGMAAVGKAAMGALGDRIGGKNALGIGFAMIAEIYSRGFGYS